MKNVKPTMIKTYKEFLKDKVLLELGKFLVAYIGDKKYLCKFNKNADVEYYELVSLR